MQPIATTKGKLTQLRYELPQRVHDATIYPVKAPNGSTILLYGHETGVNVIWRGGRPLKKAAPPPKQALKPQKVNGASNDAIMIIDSDDDEPAKAAPAPSVPQAEFEDEEEELDPDQPYPSVVQQLRLSFNTEVLHIAVPRVPAVSTLRTADSLPAIFSKKLVFTATCADSTIRVVTLPLSPPPHSAKDKPLSASSQYGEEVIKFHGHQSVARGVTMTWTSRAEPSAKYETDDEMDVDAEGDVGATPGRRRRKQQGRSRSRPGTAAGFDMLIATHSAELGGLFKIWRFELAETSINGAHPIVPYKSVTLRKPASRIAFNTAHYPKRRHSQLLITDLTGTARVYDPFAPTSRKRSASGHTEPGAFITMFKSTFESMKSNSHTPPILATRKAILDAAWTSDGRHILALLADGEWGVWDSDQSGPNPSADPAAFSLRGFVGTAEKETSSSGPSSPKRGGRSSLAPMTPNTRRRKEDHLFHGSSSGVAVPTRGGVSVASSTSSTSSTNGAAPEDSVIIWYGSEVYRIADLAKFWTRNTSAARGQSLPGPGLTQLHDIPLLGASITSITQFDSTAAASRMAIGRDILIAAEHRLVISASTNQPLGRDLGAIFAQSPAEEEDSRRVDQALLSHGELDLGGMDRLLEDMESSGSGLKSLTMGNPRKVLFASSAA